MSELLFAYGTLMSTEHTEAAKRLQREAEKIGAASTTGRLFDQGQWPGLILSSQRDELVYGELWRLRSPLSLQWLDIYEGIKPGVAFPEYARKLIWVYPADSPARQAWGYVYQWPVRESDVIPSGRWQDRQTGHLRRSKPPAFPALSGSSELPA
jgi:gamma-glutamylcyclotransferase (GGCT)/AIG2-like uncharacterized protein YtfP